MTIKQIIYVESTEIITNPKITIDEFGNEYIIYNWENADLAVIALSSKKKGNFMKICKVL